MILKNASVSRIIVLTILLPTSLFAWSAQPPPDRTGAPGSAETCADCHTGTGSGSVELQFSADNFTYEPSQTYTLSVVISDPGQSRFGFSMVARNDSASQTSVGSWTAGPDSVVYSSGTHVGHQNAPFVDNMHTFEVTWTAPSEPVDSITFYAAANAANGNFSNGAGDNVYLQTLTIALASAQSYRDQWIEQYFGAGATVDFSGDTDGDGLSEWEEYAYGLDPGTPDAEAQPTLSVPVSLSDRLTAVFRRDPQVDDLIFRVEASDDFVTWTTIAESTSGGPTTGSATIVEEAIEGSNGVLRVTVTDTAAPDGVQRRFLRLVLIDPS